MTGGVGNQRRRLFTVCAARRVATRLAYRVLQVWWFLRRPTTRGVKLLIRHQARVLFVRHTYGDRAWELPGGGVRSGEALAAAAEREAREELGLRIAAWTHFAEIESHDHATAQLGCLHADVADVSAMRLSCGEIEDHVWARPGHEPQPLGRHARKALAAYRDATFA